MIQDGGEEKTEALKVDLLDFRGRYTWVADERAIQGNPREVEEILMRQRQFWERET